MTVKRDVSYFIRFTKNINTSFVDPKSLNPISDVGTSDPIGNGTDEKLSCTSLAHVPNSAHVCDL